MSFVATGDSQITRTQATGVAVGVAIGLGGAVTVAASIVDNLIANVVEASIGSSLPNAVTTVRSGDDITVRADVSDARIVDVGATTASVGVGLFAASGGGIEINGRVDNDVTASLKGAGLTTLNRPSIGSKIDTVHAQLNSRLPRAPAKHMKQRLKTSCRTISVLATTLFIEVLRTHP